MDFEYEFSWERTLYTVAIIFGVAIAVAIFLNLRIRRYRITKSLKGKVVVITGGTAGIGEACVEELAKHGTIIHILARDLRKADMVVDRIKEASGNHNIFVHFANLNDFATVHAFAKQFLALDTKIDLLINNAALINMTRKVTVDGLEEVLQANYLSHFLLTNLLLERIVSSSPSRIVNVSSEIGKGVFDFDVREMNWEKRPYHWRECYGWSKFEMVVWTRELSRRLYGKGVTVNSLHPGVIRTSITRNFPLLFWLTPLLHIGKYFMPGPYLGTQTLLYLATSDEVQNVSGHYFENCRPAAHNVHVLDDQLASELWSESERLTRKIKSA